MRALGLLPIPYAYTFYKGTASGKSLFHYEITKNDLKKSPKILHSQLSLLEGHSLVKYFMRG